MGFFFFHIKTTKKITTVLTLYCHMVLSQSPRKKTSMKPAYVSGRLVVKFREANKKG